MFGPNCEWSVEAKRGARLRRVRPVLPLVLAAILLPSGCTPSDDDEAETYPAQPVKVIVPFGAGGGTDTFARIVEKAVDENDLWPQPLVIVNLGGAGGTIGSQRARNADPDGYTVMVLHNAILTARQTRLVNYGPEAFEAVAGTGFVGQVIAVWDRDEGEDDARDFESLDELMAAAKERPNEIRWGSNLGALTHFSGLQLQQTRPGTAFRFVPSGGGAERFADLKGGHIDVTGFSLEEFSRFRKDGVRGLAFLGGADYAHLTDVPRAEELGYDVVRDNHFYWWMPKGTPPDRVDAFAGMLKQVMELPEVRERLKKGGIEPVFFRGDDLQKRIAAAEERNSTIRIPPPPSLPNLPLYTLGTVVLLAGLVVVNVVRKRLSSGDGGGEPRVDFPLRPALAAGCVLLLGAYVAVMALGWVPFVPATLVFVLAAGMAISREPKRQWPLVVGLAVVLAFGVEWTFTEVFEVVLP